MNPLLHVYCTVVKLSTLLFDGGDGTHEGEMISISEDACVDSTVRLDTDCILAKPVHLSSIPPNQTGLTHWRHNCSANIQRLCCSCLKHLASGVVVVNAVSTVILRKPGSGILLIFFFLAGYRGRRGVGRTRRGRWSWWCRDWGTRASTTVAFLAGLAVGPHQDTEF